jgi:uncharacterized protein (TIGR00661 family)
MAKILFGVAGEGFGHSSRSELLGQHLIDAGHDVIFAASRKSFDYLQPTFNGRVRQVHGLSFYYQNGHVRPIRTVMQNLWDYRRGIGFNRRFFSSVEKDFEPDLVISDFEPFSAWWAWRNRVPCVSIDHEHFLSCCRFATEGASLRERSLAKVVMQGYHTFADAYMVLNFFKAPLTNENAQLVPPVVRKAVLRVRPRNDEHFLVYSTDSGEKMRKRIVDAVSQHTGYRFYIYGFNQESESGNCAFKKTSTETFLNNLASCRGVIATAGFSLLSECLYFRKPMLLMPVRDQYEQIINACYVEKLGMGLKTEHLTGQKLQEFFARLQTFRFDHPLTILPNNPENLRLLNNRIKSLGFDLGLKP